MIDNNTKFEILFQKSENIENKRQRIFLVIILLPIIFLLLKSSVIEEIDFSLFSIKQINIILIFYPSLFISLIFYISILTNHNSKVINELNFIATNNQDVNQQYQQENWLKIIYPINILGNILGSIKTNGTVGCLGAFFVFIPLLLFVIIYPLFSLLYFIYFDYTLINSEFKYYSLGNIIFSIWSILALIIYTISERRNFC